MKLKAFLTKNINYILGALLLFFTVVLVLLFIDKFYVINGLNVNFMRNESNNEVLASEFLGLLDKSNLKLAQNLPIKSANGKTGVLIAGIDSRDVYVKNGEFINPNPQGTRHIDSIMQIVFDHQDNEVYQISIPRDTGVDIRLDCLKFSGNIHWLYSRGQRSKCEGGGISVLKEGVRSVTGIESQYYIIVSLKAFPEIIQAVGEKNSKGEVGIYVENERTFSDIYPADNNTGWENVTFPKGKLFLTPRRALQFARTRQYTSDFDRAKRQQLVVKSVFKRLLQLDIITNPTKIQELLGIFDNSVLMSKPQSVSEILDLVSVANLVNVDNIHSMVLDPSFGGGKTGELLRKPPHNRPGAYYLIPTHWKECPGNEFCKVQEKIQYYMDNPNELNSSK